MKNITLILTDEQLEVLHTALLSTPHDSKEFTDMIELIEDVQNSVEYYKIFDLTV